MMRYALIDIDSGFVWWVGDADTAAQACSEATWETGQEEADYCQVLTWDHYGASGYQVYIAPADFECPDGQDQAIIERITLTFPRVGRFRRKT